MGTRTPKKRSRTCGLNTRMRKEKAERRQHEMSKKLVGAARICPHCDEKIENPNINYCPNCNNILWSRSLLRRGIGKIK